MRFKTGMKVQHIDTKKIGVVTREPYSVARYGGQRMVEYVDVGVPEGGWTITRQWNTDNVREIR